MHGIDSIRFQLVANHLERKRINAVRQQTIVFHDLLKRIPWAVFDRLVDEHGADGDARAGKSKAPLLALLDAEFSGGGGLREIEANLRSHAGELRHLGVSPMSRSTLSTANAGRPAAVFAGLLAALIASLQAGYRRKVRDCVRLIDSTCVQLSSLSDW